MKINHFDTEDYNNKIIIIIIIKCTYFKYVKYGYVRIFYLYCFGYAGLPHNRIMKLNVPRRHTHRCYIQHHDDTCKHLLLNHNVLAVLKAKHFQCIYGNRKLNRNIPRWIAKDIGTILF